MATTTMTLNAERWLDEVILSAAVADVADDDMSESYRVPAGLGDIAIIECWMDINSITTPISTVELAARLAIFNADLSTVIDLVGIAKIYKVTVNKAGCYWSPDPLVLWRQNELLHLNAPDLDTGTTADLNLYVKAVRVRPAESVGMPIQLVR